MINPVSPVAICRREDVYPAHRAVFRDPWSKLMGGVQLISIGVLGEYLSRKLMEIIGRPGCVSRRAAYRLV